MMVGVPCRESLRTCCKAAASVEYVQQHAWRIYRIPIRTGLDIPPSMQRFIPARVPFPQRQPRSKRGIGLCKCVYRCGVCVWCVWCEERWKGRKKKHGRLRALEPFRKAARAANLVCSPRLARCRNQARGNANCTSSQTPLRPYRPRWPCDKRQGGRTCSFQSDLILGRRFLSHVDMWKGRGMCAAVRTSTSRPRSVL